LSLIEATTDPLLIVNGDILTQLDFRAMLDFHRDYQADMTVAVRVHEVPVPYGIVETSGIEITGILEKPILRHPINCGIYVVNPDIRRYVPTGQRFDMPDLIQRLVREGRRVISFHVREYWLDIGLEKDYQKALADVENGEV
jgi:NDP-sugar pyrophosphorylase family protein